MKKVNVDIFRGIPGLRVAFLAIVWLILLVLPAYAREERIAGIRIGPHNEYHRFVVELTGSAAYKVKRAGSVVTIEMARVAAEYPPGTMPATDYVRVKGLEKAMDGAINIARLEVAVVEGAVVKQTNWDEPFRIVLDVYPVDPLKAPAKSAQKEAPKPAEPDKKPKAAPDEVVRAGVKTVTFNNGWRWVYRKKVMGRLLQEELEDESLRNRVYASELGLKTDGKDELLKKTEELIGLMKTSGGGAGDLPVLEAAYRFFDEEEDPSDLEAALRHNPESRFKRLGQFLLAGYYEMQGFVPEAHGYYSLILRGKSDAFVRSAASFQRGRLLFSEARYGNARKAFEEAGKKGFPGASLWLASTLMIKGELDQAWDIFSKVKMTEDMDRVSLLSLGDIYMVKGRFDSARDVFERLRSLDAGDELTSAFFSLKAADTYLAEGRKAEAEDFYTKSKEKLNGEGWALAALSLADSLSSGTDRVALARAEPLYRKVADGHFLGSEAAHVSLIDTLARLGKYREAMAEVESFQKEFNTSVYRADIQLISGRLVAGWIESLYNGSDYAGVVQVAALYGSMVPFGKKADSSLKTGKSFVALGLYTDAIESLDSASKMGNKSVAEEAMMELGRVYLRQRDAAATVRLYKAFAARFPKSRYTDEVNGILLKTAFLGKEYREAAVSRDNGQPDAIVLKARAMVKIDDHEHAAELFMKAARLFEGRGDMNGAAGAWIGLADSKFALGDYKSALEWYKKASTELKDGGQDKSWTLYRIAECYSRLDVKDAGNDAVKDLKGRGGEYGELASPVFGAAPKSF